MLKDNQNYMNIAKDEAMMAFSKGEIPVGAVIVKDGKIIGRGHNLKETLNDSTAHAEIIAIKEASKFINDWRLDGCDLYVTLEPCSMCISAIIQSRISKVYIGTFNKDMGACGSYINLVDERHTNLEINWMYDDECSKLLVDFFKKQRKN